MTYTTLDPRYPTSGGQDDRLDPAVASFLELISKNHTEKIDHDSKMLAVQDLYENGINIKTPVGNVKITSKLLMQAVENMISITKPLDYILFAAGRKEGYRKMVAAGLSTALDVGGFLTQFRGKMGISFEMLLYGDCFLQIYETGDPDCPIEYLVIPATNIYTDLTAVGVYGNGRGRDATKLVTINPMTWGEFCSRYPAFKGKVTKGKIPRETVLKDQNLTWVQETDSDEDIVEVACGYDIVNKCYAQFAGASCTIIEKFEKDQYPFMDGKKAYMPILQFLCKPSSKGLYNHGIGGMLYDVALVMQSLLNMGIAHVEETVYPIELVNTAQGQSVEFLKKLKMAYEMRKNGQRAVVAVERNPIDGSGNVEAQSFMTVNNGSEFQQIMDFLDREVRRWGIVVDAIDRGENRLATQILAEEEAQMMFVKQMMEYNASNFKRLGELSLLILKSTKKSKMPLNISTEIELENPETGEVEAIIPENLTMDVVQDELKKNHYYVKVNARSGTYPSNVFRGEQLLRVMQNAQPGSAAHLRALKEWASNNDFDAKGEDFIMAQPPMPGEGGEEMPPEAEEMLAGLPTGTDKLTVNARQPQVPLLQ